MSSGSLRAASAASRFSSDSAFNSVGSPPISSLWRQWQTCGDTLLEILQGGASKRHREDIWSSLIRDVRSGDCRPKSVSLTYSLPPKRSSTKRLQRRAHQRYRGKGRRRGRQHLPVFCQQARVTRQGCRALVCQHARTVLGRFSRCSRHLEPHPFPDPPASYGDQIRAGAGAPSAAGNQA
jgi:hypothetical protein